VELIDVYPTLLRLARLSPTQTPLHGRSLLAPFLGTDSVGGTGKHVRSFLQGSMTHFFSGLSASPGPPGQDWPRARSRACPSTTLSDPAPGHFPDQQLQRFSMPLQGQVTGDPNLETDVFLSSSQAPSGAAAAVLPVAAVLEG